MRWTFFSDTNIWRKQLVHRYLENNICYFRSPISPWRGPQWNLLFGAFFLGMVYIFTIPKISLHWGPLQPFLNIDRDFDNICFLKNLQKKFGTKFGSLPSKKVQNFLLGRFIERETRVYFWPFFNIQKPYWPSCPIVQWVQVYQVPVHQMYQ